MPLDFIRYRSGTGVRRMASRLAKRARHSTHRVVQALAGVAVAAALLVAPQPAAAATEIPVPSASAAEPTPTATPSPSGSAPVPVPSPSPSPSSPSPSTSPSTSKAPAKTPAKAKAAEPCGGAITMGTVVECAEIKDKQHAVHTLTTTADDERLTVVLRQLIEGGDGLGAMLTDPAGETVCYLGSYPNDCRLGAAGTYTITVSLIYGTGSNGYAL